MSDENNTFENDTYNNVNGTPETNYQGGTSYQNGNGYQNGNNHQDGNNYQNGMNYQNGNNYPNGNNYNGSGKGQGTGFGITSMVCGILSIVLICSVYVGAPLLTYVAPLLGIIAIVFGIVQIVKNESKAMAIAGIVCGAIGILIFIALICIGLWAISSGFYGDVMRYYDYY